MRELRALRDELNVVVHGTDTRPGLKAVVLDMYGDVGRKNRGLMVRMELLEEGVTKLIATRRENNLMLRGILIGVGLLTLDTMFSLNIPARLWSIFGLG